MSSLPLNTRITKFPNIVAGKLTSAASRLTKADLISLARASAGEELPPNLKRLKIEDINSIEVAFANYSPQSAALGFEATAACCCCTCTPCCSSSTASSVIQPVRAGAANK